MKKQHFIECLILANPNQFPEKETVLRMVTEQMDELDQRELPRGECKIPKNIFSQIVTTTGEIPTTSAIGRFVRVVGKDSYVDIIEYVD